MMLLHRLTAHLRWSPLRFPGVFISHAPVSAVEVMGLLRSAGINPRIPANGCERILSKTMYLVNLDGKLELRRVDGVAI